MCTCEGERGRESERELGTGRAGKERTGKERERGKDKKIMYVLEREAYNKERKIRFR